MPHELFRSVLFQETGLYGMMRQVPRPAKPNEYVLRVNLKDGNDVRRFCEVRVKDGEVYMFQPKKGRPVKVSYHKSGQKHVKIGAGRAIMPPMYLDPTATIITEETPWVCGFQNFADLLPYKGETANDVLEVDVPPPSVSTITFAEVAIGRSFDPNGWTTDGVDLMTLRQEVFAVPQSTNGLQVCVRIRRLEQAS